MEEPKTGAGVAGFNASGNVSGRNPKPLAESFPTPTPTQQRQQPKRRRSQRLIEKQVLGQQIKSYHELFDVKELAVLFSPAKIRATPARILGNTIFVAIDPCGGASGSKLGIHAIYYSEDGTRMFVRMPIFARSVVIVMYTSPQHVYVNHRYS